MTLKCFLVGNCEIPASDLHHLSLPVVSHSSCYPLPTQFNHYMLIHPHLKQASKYLTRTWGPRFGKRKPLRE